MKKILLGGSILTITAIGVVAGIKLYHTSQYQSSLGPNTVDGITVTYLKQTEAEKISGVKPFKKDGQVVYDLSDFYANPAYNGLAPQNVLDSLSKSSK